jgi:isopentenyldiphosphate isomerase
MTTIELLDVIDYQGVVIDTASRDEVHLQGLRHRAINIIGFLPNGKMVCQKRHHTKKVNPGQLITFVSGHVQSGLSPTEAAIEEIREESGLTVAEKDLQFLGITHFDVEHTNGLLDDEYVFLYALQIQSLEELVPEANEVEEFVALSLEEIAYGQTPLTDNLKERHWLRIYAKASKKLFGSEI